MPSQVKYPNVVTEGTGGASWTSRDSIKTDNGSPGYHYNSTFGHTNQFSGSTVSSANLLTLSDFGFTIPTGSTIDGVILRAKRKATRTQDPQVISTPEFYYELQPALSGTNNGTAQSTGGITGTSYVTDSYGSSTNKLGITLTVADINSSNFQIKLTSESTAYYDAEEIDLGGGFFQWFYYGSDIYAEYDFVSVEVFYTEPKKITPNSASFTVTGNGADLLRKYTLAPRTGRFATAGKGPMLLDGIDAPAIAYSLQKIRAGYTGSAIRVRRSSDNTVQDIGFDANGNLDETALLSFVGSGDGFIRTWYDQSTNGFNAENTTTASQPRIVVAGAVEKVNGKPALNFFTGVASYQLQVVGAVGVFNNKTHGEIYAVAQSVVTTASNRYLIIFRINTVASTLARFGMLDSFAASTFASGGRGFSDGSGLTTVSASATHNTTSQYLVTSFASWQSGGVIGVRQNAGSEGTTAFNGSGSSPSTNSNGVFIGTNGSTGRWGGYMQQLVVLNTDQTQNRVGNEEQINSAWEIYPSASMANLLNNKRLAPVTGSFALTGIAADLERQILLTADTTAFNVTPYDINLLPGLKIKPIAASFALSGNDANISPGFNLVADARSYALTGVGADLERGYPLVADVSSYAVTGINTDLEWGRRYSVFTGNYVWTGNANELIRGFKLTADTESCVVGGIANDLRYARVYRPLTGNYTFTGIAADLEKNYGLVADARSYTLTGIDVNFKYIPSLKPVSRSYSVTGPDAGVLFGRRLGPMPGAYAWTGINADLEKGSALPADQGQFDVTFVDASVEAGWDMDAETTSFALTGIDTSLVYTRILTAQHADFVLFGDDVGFKLIGSMKPATVHYDIVTPDVELKLSAIMSLDTVAFICAGSDVALTITKEMPADTGGIDITTPDTDLRRTVLLAPISQTYTTNHEQAGLIVGYNLYADAGAYDITALDAEFVVFYRLAADSRAFTHNGIAAGLKTTRILTADSEPYTLAGIAANVIPQRKIFPVTRSYALTGMGVDLLQQRLMPSDLGPYVVTLQDSEIIAPPNFSTEGVAVLPSGKADLSYIYRAADRAKVAFDDNVMIEIDGSIAIHQYQIEVPETKGTYVRWRGVAKLSANSCPIRLQVWNYMTSSWDTRSVNTTASAGVETELTTVIVADSSSYIDANNRATIRIWQGGSV